ncbi:MAG TPA: hypothetical protein DDZ51_06570 [Planctomycetaceae bacterium]|nr:hypothetical protein [Planctomycetaceae bacterium]
MTNSKVFGIGLSRTGTKSLAAALNMLGIRTKWYPQDYQTYCELLMANYRLSILEKYDGLTDTPVVPYYAQFDSLYPGSRFVLTVRNKQLWLASCAKHWANSGIKGPESINAPFWRHFAQWIDSVVYGSYQFNADRWSYVYDTHIRNVAWYFSNRPNDLLVLDVSDKDAFHRLSTFLGCDALPGPFPTVNDFQSPLLG